MVGMAESATHVTEVRSSLEIDQVRDLLREFVAWHRERHVEDLRLIDAYFDPRVFDAELAGLPGSYARPSGRLLLARLDGEPVGCVALKRIDSSACEMKRMFVRPTSQGQGAGRALAEAVVDEARAAGYATMWLDTSVRQTEAQALYLSLGFEPAAPYYEMTPELAAWLVFLRKDLSASSERAVSARGRA